MDPVRIGIVTSAGREESYSTGFKKYPDLLIEKMDFESSEDPDLRAKLIYWDELNYDIAIIDEAHITDKRKLVSDVKFFQTRRRGEACHMRIIFVASKERGPQDFDIKHIANYGVTDFVLPYRGENFSRIIYRIQHPAKYSDIVTLLDDSIERSAEETERRSVVERSIERSHRMRSVVAISSVAEKSGCSNYTYAVAQTLALMGHSVGVVIPEQDLVSMKNAYKMSSEGSLDFRIKGGGLIRFFAGQRASDAPQDLDFVLVDIGYIPWEKADKLSPRQITAKVNLLSDAMADLYSALPDDQKKYFFTRTSEQQDKYLEFSRADIKIVYSPITTYKLLAAFQLFLQAEKSRLGSYVVVEYGVPKSVEDKINNPIKKSSPDCKIVKAETYLWPLMDSTIHQEIIDAVSTCLAPQDLIHAQELINNKPDEEAPLPKKGLFSKMRKGQQNG